MYHEIIINAADTPVTRHTDVLMQSPFIYARFIIVNRNFYHTIFLTSTHIVARWIHIFAARRYASAV